MRAFWKGIDKFSSSSKKGYSALSYQKSPSLDEQYRDFSRFSGGLTKSSNDPWDNHAKLIEGFCNNPLCANLNCNNKPFMPCGDITRIQIDGHFTHDYIVPAHEQEVKQTVFGANQDFHGKPKDQKIVVYKHPEEVSLLKVQPHEASTNWIEKYEDSFVDDVKNIIKKD